MSDESSTSKEEFQLARSVFIDAIRLIASEPEAQAKAMGNFNVAWELKNDAEAGEYLISMPGTSLSSVQASAIRDFLEILSRIPAETLKGASTPEQSLAALRTESWRGLRPEAARLLAILGEG